MKHKTNADFDISFYEGVVKRSPNYIEALIPLAEAYTRKGLFDKGLEIDRRLATLCKDDPIIYYNLGCSYALVGKNKEALKALKKAIQLGYDDFRHMRKDADLKPLHGEPAFENLFP
jgi:tetratricopeptide (TPR) repeat protein